MVKDDIVKEEANKKLQWTMRSVKFKEKIALF